MLGTPSLPALKDWEFVELSFVEGSLRSVRVQIEVALTVHHFYE